MKKVKSYYLDEIVIDHIKERAKENDRGCSDWLNLHLKKGITTQSKEIKPVKPNTDEFELVWNMYGKKGNKKTSLSKFNRLKDSNKKLMAEHLPRYVKSKPDKQYRKNLETYINQECWNDEIEDFANEKTTINNRNYETPTDRSRIAADKLRRQQQTYSENTALIQIND